MKNKIFWVVVLSLLLSPNLWADSKKIRIVTTTSTLASLTREIVKDEAEIYFIAPPNRDIHFISPTPKDVLKTKKADVFIHGGLDLEMWRGPLLDAVGRMDLMAPSGEKQIDASQGIELLDIPTSLSRHEGDIHAFGNPHYAVDPVRALQMIQNIQEGLSRIYPEQASRFKANADQYSEKLRQKMTDWQKRMEPFKGFPVITYHRSWTYLAARFGFEVLGQLEPKPGIPPTSKHLIHLIHLVKEKNIRVIIKESYNEKHTAQKIARETGAVVLDLTQSVERSKDYISMVESNISKLEKAWSK